MSAPIEVEVKLVTLPNEYGFGHNWYLEVRENPAAEGEPARFASMRLGQDAKVAARLLGTTMDALVQETCDESGSEDWDANEPLVRARVLEALGATTPEAQAELLDLEPWNLSVD
jgi:hypothetical protein